MRTNLSMADLGDLLERPILAVMATRRPDGTAMLSPVWYEWDGDAIVIWTTGPTEGKNRHLAADPHTTVVIAEPVMPYRGLEVTGWAELTSEGFDAAVRRISARYVSQAEADQLAAGFEQPGTLIRIHPDRLRAWDFVDEWNEAPA